MTGVTGTSETAIWQQDGQYLAMTAGEAITLGMVVKIGSTDGYVVIADASATNVLGVVASGYRASRIATDNTVASGGLATVATRGVVNVTCTGTVTRGELVQTDTAGTVKTLTLSATADAAKIIGMALTTGTSTTVSVKLMRG